MCGLYGPLLMIPITRYTLKIYKDELTPMTQYLNGTGRNIENTLIKRTILSLELNYY